MISRRILAFFLFVVGVPFLLHAADDVSSTSAMTSISSSAINVALTSSTSSENVEYSTTPIGSPFMRRLAFEYNQDVLTLAKFEKKGFGRAETITLLLIAESMQKPLKDLGNERLKNKTSLRKLAEQAGLNYDDLYQVVYEMKSDIEAKGENNLPPPVFEKKEPTHHPDVKPRKKNKEKKTTDQDKSKEENKKAKEKDAIPS